MSAPETAQARHDRNVKAQDELALRRADSCKSADKNPSHGSAIEF